MKKLNIIHLLIFCLSCIFISCQDDDSAKEGPQGEQGPKGEQGEPGEPGNANVFVSDWIPSEITHLSVYSSYFDVNEPLVDENFLNSGILLAYGKYMNSSYIVPLPYIEQHKNYLCYMFPGKIRFVANSIEGNHVFEEFSHFRYVLIPSNSETGRKIDFRNLSYEEAMIQLGLGF